MAELDVVQKEPRIGCIAGTKKRPHPYSVDVAKYSLIVVIVAITSQCFTWRSRFFFFDDTYLG